MPLDCKDVPVYVWKDVREKWSKVKFSSDIDWSVCSLCDFMYCGDVSDKYDHNLDTCENCPLFKYDACAAHPLISKLHIYYWIRNASLDEAVWEIELAWTDYLKKFLTKLDALIEELES